MSLIRLDINSAQRTNEQFRKHILILDHIQEELNVIRRNLEPKVAASGQISYDLANCINRTASLERELQDLHSFISKSINEYALADNRVQNNARLSGLVPEKTSLFDRIYNGLKDGYNQFDRLIHNEALWDKIKSALVQGLKDIAQLAYKIHLKPIVDVMKVIADFLEEHPRLAAALTIIGGLISGILAGVAYVSAGLTVGIAATVILAALVVIFGVGGAFQAWHDVRTYNDAIANGRKGEDGNKLKVSTIVDENKQKAEKCINEDYNLFRGMLRSIVEYQAKAFNANENNADRTTWKVYNNVDFFVTFASLTVDIYNLPKAITQVQGIVPKGKTIVSELREVKQLMGSNLAGVITRDFNRIKTLHNYNELDFKDIPSLLDNSISNILSTINNTILRNNLNGRIKTVGIDTLEISDLLVKSPNMIGDGDKVIGEGKRLYDYFNSIYLNNIQNPNALVR